MCHSSGDTSSSKMANLPKALGQLNEILYKVNDIPPWYLCLLLGLQHIMTCFGSLFTLPAIVSPSLCLEGDGEGKAQLVSTAMFISGIATLLQCTFGTRLPIIQGVSYSFLVPLFVVMALNEENCPYNHPETYNVSALPPKGSDYHRGIWHGNMATLGGSLMVASVLQIVIGFTGFLGLMLRYIGPLTVAPTITLISLTLFETAAGKGSVQWYICFMTIVLMALFSQYLRNVELPCLCMARKIKFFALFSVLLSVGLSWLICVILTETDVLTDDPKKWGYGARTDIQSDALHDADWFRFPYPGQWGSPKVAVGGVCGMMAAIFASVIESVGDYYACARLSGAPPPPTSAVNRGIGMEGISCLLAGLWGVPIGYTSYSQNVGAIGITKVGSRIVTQAAGAMMIVLGLLGKFGALFVTIPDPVVGGIFFVMFGMVAAVGVSNLQHVNLNSPRNLFVFGFALFFGLSAPQWVKKQYDFNTGSEIVDQVLEVLTSTGMFVGGLVAFILDNTIPGTRKERGMLYWNQLMKSDDDANSSDMSTYDLPLIQPCLNRTSCIRYVPFCPGYMFDRPRNGDSDDELRIDQSQNDVANSWKSDNFRPDHVGSNSAFSIGSEQEKDDIDGNNVNIRAVTPTGLDHPVNTKF